MGIYSVDKLMAETRRIAAEYRRTMGKSLGGVSGEIAIHDACRLLGLEPVTGNAQTGYDAVGRGEREGKRVQIKGRAIFDETKGGQRIGQLKVEQDWDSVVLVLMDDNFEPVELYEADRAEVIDALDDAGTSKRAKRGAMSVAKFKNVGRMVWNSTEGLVDDEIWDNRGQG